MDTKGPILILARTPLDTSQIAIARHLLEDSGNRLVLLGNSPSWDLSPGEQVVRVGGSPACPDDIPGIGWTELYAFVRAFPRILTLS